MRNEGVLAFYKGTATPLFGVGVYVSTQFGMFHFLKRFFGNINEKKGRNELSGGQLFMSGFGAGVAASFVACPSRIGGKADDRPNGTCKDSIADAETR